MRKSSKLVLNKSKDETYTKLTVNLVPQGCRIETLEGREHIAVPMVMLVEGVHNGSAGSLYYPKEELGKTPAVWNHKPIVVYHPTLNGEGISACDPDIINKRKVGVMMNTKFEKGKLKSEAWIERSRADLVDERIMKAIDNKKVMELSTGLFIDVANEEGKWEKEDYTGIARNYRPDHLALLPDQIGACSIADGAGLCRNQSQPITKEVLAQLELSYNSIQQMLATAIQQKLNFNSEKGPWIWIADVYSNFFIYEKDSKFWRLGYTANDAGVTLSDEDPVEVKRVTEYRTIKGERVGNQNTETQVMNKKKLIAFLMANAVTVVNGVTLSADMPEDQLAKLTDEHLETALNDALKEAKKKEAPKTESKKDDKTTDNKEVIIKKDSETPKVVTMQDYVNSAPPEIREVLTSGLNTLTQKKAGLIAEITANKSNVFSKEYLEARNVQELEGIAALARVPAANQTALPYYGGQAPTPTTTTNVKPEPLPLPTMNWEKKAAAGS